MKENMETEVIIGVDALDSAIEYIGKNFNPEDVFKERDLIGWAESNGYTKE